jgi:hypothetical protein
MSYSYFHHSIIKFAGSVYLRNIKFKFNIYLIFKNLNRKLLCISKSIMEKRRFNCRIKIRLLHNFVPLYDFHPWSKHSLPYPCYATDHVLNIFFNLLNVLFCTVRADQLCIDILRVIGRETLRRF